jgi:hypothetical protein
MQQHAVEALDGLFGNELDRPNGNQDGGQVEVDGP